MGEIVMLATQPSLAHRVKGSSLNSRYCSFHCMVFTVVLIRSSPDFQDFSDFLTTASQPINQHGSKARVFTNK